VVLIQELSVLIISLLQVAVQVDLQKVGRHQARRGLADYVAQ
jgi:hypothetical protein